MKSCFPRANEPRVGSASSRERRRATHGDTQSVTLFARPRKTGALYAGKGAPSRQASSPDPYVPRPRTSPVSARQEAGPGPEGRPGACRSGSTPRTRACRTPSPRSETVVVVAGALNQRRRPRSADPDTRVRREAREDLFERRAVHAAHGAKARRRLSFRCSVTPSSRPSTMVSFRWSAVPPSKRRRRRRASP